MNTHSLISLVYQTGCLLQAMIGKVGITLCCGGACVPQQLLYFVERSAVVDECAGIAVTQVVYAHAVQTQLLSNAAPTMVNTAKRFVCLRVCKQPTWFVGVQLVL